VLGGKVTTIFLGLLINALLARLLVPSAFGAYFTVYSLVVIGSTVAQLGLDRAVVRVVAASLGADEPGRARHAIRTVFLFGGIGSIVIGLALVAGVGGWLATNVYRSPLVASVIPISAGWLVATAMQSLLVETFRGFQRFDLATLLDALLVDVLAGSTFAAVWLLHADVTLHQVLVILTAATTVTLLIAAALLIGRVRNLRGEGQLDRREVFSIAWPLMITNLGSYLVGTAIDVWVLGAFRPQADVALYASAARLMIFVATPFVIIQGVAAPIVAEMMAQGRKPELAWTLRGLATLTGIPSSIALLLFLAFGGAIMGAFYGPFYRQAAVILAVLSVGRLIAVGTGSCAVTLMMSGYQRALMFITIGFGSVSVVSGALLASRFGAVGLAVSTSAIIAMQNIFTLIVARRKTGIWTHAYASPRRLLAFLRGAPALAGRTAR
jgi:O-antigen/teichoic acid export membrane protein